MRRALLSAALVLAAAGCDTRAAIVDPIESVCSAEVRRVTVAVVAPNGEPLEGLRATSVVLTTGEALNVGAGGTEGVYPVADDSHRDAFADGSRIVRFTASDASLFAQAEFVFSYDGCHIVKEAGPTEVVARARG